MNSIQFQSVAQSIKAVKAAKAVKATESFLISSLAYTAPTCHSQVDADKLLALVIAIGEQSEREATANPAANLLAMAERLGMQIR